MNHQTIIAKKIEFLNGNSKGDISSDMQAEVDSDQNLKDEILFVESIWVDKSLQNEQQPSASLDARFYQMLSQAQSSKHQIDSKEPLANGWFESVKNIFSIQPFAQLALLTMLFFGGWFANDYTEGNTNNSTAKLQQQVQSLNVMVALSMLNNQSTTERLAGVSYAADSQISNSKITQVLFDILNRDRSSAVRLAVIDVLSTQANESVIQSQLIDSLNENQSTMVQASLARLILSTNNRLTSEELFSLFKEKGVDTEVIDYLISRSNKNDDGKNTI